MNRLITAIVTGWSVNRLVQLILGVACLASGIYYKDSIYYFVSVIFLLQALLNISFCGAGGCGVPRQRSHDRKVVEFEEYKPQKK